MVREDIQACLRIGAAAATILVLLGGPLGLALFTLDAGLEKATTRCESRGISEIVDLRLRRAHEYELFVNAKLNVLSAKLGHDLRPDSERTKALEPISVDVAEHQRDAAWEAIPRLTAMIGKAVEEVKKCPDYGGILE